MLTGSQVRSVLVMKNTKGFSLLEVVIAFAIMAISVTVLLRIFATGVNSAGLSEDYTIAVQIAESLMAKAGVDVAMEQEQSSGIEGDKYQWNMQVRPINIDIGNPDQTTDQPQYLAVTVQVEWDDNPPRMYELKQIKPKIN